MAWYTRALNLLRRDAVSRDIDRELAFHVAERTDELVEGGMNQQEAAREAERRFGHRSTLRETTREVDVLTWLESVATDVRQAVRALRASPGFAFVAVLSLALGIGANTAIFSLLNAVLLRSLPVDGAASLVTVTTRGSGTDFSIPLWEQLRDRQTVLAGVGAFARSDFNLAGGGEVRRVTGNWVSGSFFGTVGVGPARGRLIAPADDKRGCAPVVVLSHGFWQSEYGGSPAVIGQSLTLYGHPFAIVGVAARGFTGVEVGRPAQVYAPLCAEGFARAGDGDIDEHHRWFLHVIGRLPAGVSAADAQHGLSSIASAVMANGLAAEDYAGAQRDPGSYAFVVTPGVRAFSDLGNTYRDALFALMAVVSVVLLIGCANVANLLLARAAARQREIAVRFALGARRLRVVRQLVTETMVLTLLGALAGVVFAQWSSGLLVRLLSAGNSAVGLDVPLDTRVLLFTTAVATAVGLLFGLAPAWRSTRTSPHDAMRAHGRGLASSHARFPVTKVLVVGQVALSLVLVVAAGLLLGTFRTLSTLDPGFTREGVLLVHADLQNAVAPAGATMANAPPAGATRAGATPANATAANAPDAASRGTRAATSDALRVLAEALLQRYRTIPDAGSVSASQLTPVSGQGWNGPIAVDGYTPRTRKDALIFLNEVSDGFFTTLGTRMTAGRSFDTRDQRGSPKVAVINETLAHKFFAGQNALHRQFRMPMPRGDDPGPPYEVIGIVEDAKYASLREAPRPTAYLPMQQSDDPASAINYEIRTTGNIRSLVAEVTAMTHDVNPRISLSYRTLGDQVAASLVRERLLATLSAFFGALALLLAVVGLYGTMSYSVARRRTEIGIRLALGAARPKVLRMVLGEVSRMLVAGLVIGIVGAVACSRFVASFLFGVAPTDTGTFAAAAATLTLVVLAAGALPAWRAARLDPMTALRED